MYLILDMCIHTHVYTLIYTYIHTYTCRTAARSDGAQRSAGCAKRELEYRIPRLHSPINSLWGDFWRFIQEENNIPVGIRGRPFFSHLLP